VTPLNELSAASMYTSSVAPLGSSGEAFLRGVLLEGAMLSGEFIPMEQR